MKMDTIWIEANEIEFALSASIKLELKLICIGTSPIEDVFEFEIKDKEGNYLDNYGVFLFGKATQLEKSKK